MSTISGYYLNKGSVGRNISLLSRESAARLNHGEIRSFLNKFRMARFPKFLMFLDLYALRLSIIHKFISITSYSITSAIFTEHMDRICVSDNEWDERFVDNSFARDAFAPHHQAFFVRSWFFNGLSPHNLHMYISFAVSLNNMFCSYYWTWLHFFNRFHLFLSIIRAFQRKEGKNDFYEPLLML